MSTQRADRGGRRDPGAGCGAGRAGRGRRRPHPARRRAGRRQDGVRPRLRRRPRASPSGSPARRSRSCTSTPAGWRCTISTPTGSSSCRGRRPRHRRDARRAGGDAGRVGRRDPARRCPPTTSRCGSRSAPATTTALLSFAPVARAGRPAPAARRCRGAVARSVADPARARREVRRADPRHRDGHRPGRLRHRRPRGRARVVAFGPRASGTPRSLTPAIEFVVRQARIELAEISVRRRRPRARAVHRPAGRRGVGQGHGPGAAGPDDRGVQPRSAGVPGCGSRSRRIVAVIDARRGEVFYAFYRQVPGGVQRLDASRPSARRTTWRRSCWPTARSACWSATARIRYRDRLSTGLTGRAGRRRLQSIRRPARSCYSPTHAALREEWVKPWDIEPLYLRKPDAEINWSTRDGRDGAPAGAARRGASRARVDLRRRRDADAPAPPPRRAAHRGPGVPAAVVARPVHRRARAAGQPASTSWPGSAARSSGYGGLMLVGGRRPHHHHRGRPGVAAPRDRHPAAARSWPARPSRRGVEQPHARGAGLQRAAPRRCTARFGFAPAGIRKRLLRREQRGCPRDVGPRRRRPPTYAEPARRASRPASPGTHASCEALDGAMSGVHDRSGHRVLGIETSCDETAAARGRRAPHVVLSSVVSSQVDLHARFGGVVPEIASRAHVELLTPVIAQALVEAGRRRRRRRRGGGHRRPGPRRRPARRRSAAKALALVWDVPFVAVNHLEAHLYAALLEEPDLELPLVVLLVSGGHTLLVLDGGPRPVPGAGLDHRRRRRRGVRQGGPLPRASATPAGRPSTGVADGGRPDGHRLPPGDARRRLRLLLQRAQDVGGQPRAQAPRGRDRRRGGLVPGGGGRRAGHQGPAGRPRASAPRAMCLGGGVAANSLLRERLLDACVADGLHGVPAQPGHVHRQRRHGGGRRLVAPAVRRPRRPRRGRRPRTCACPSSD